MRVLIKMSTCWRKRHVRRKSYHQNLSQASSFSIVTSAVPKSKKLEAKLEVCVRHNWQGLGGRRVAAGVTPVVPDSLEMDGNKPPRTNSATAQT